MGALIRDEVDVKRVTFGGVVGERVGECADQVAVLVDGAAAHAVDNTARSVKQTRVGNADDHGFIVAAVLVACF